MAANDDEEVFEIDVGFISCMRYVNYRAFEFGIKRVKKNMSTT